MDANNSNPNSLQKWSIFSSKQEEPTTTSPQVDNVNGDVNSNLSQQQVLTIDQLTQQVMQKVDKQLYEKLGDKGINVIKQREVIESQSQEKKVLEEQLKQSLQVQEDLRTKLNELEQKVSNMENRESVGDLADIKDIKAELANLHKYQLEQKLKPVVEYIANQGVNREDIPRFLEHIQKNYKTDFYTNPDMDIVEYMLARERQANAPTQTYSVPKGSYSVNQTSNYSAQMQQQMLQETLAAQEEAIRKRAELRKQRAKIA